jgi:hypothetical protein
MKYLSFLALLILLSCSNGEVRHEVTDAPYRTSGVEQYFLPELPAWANYSASGKCYKQHSFIYLDLAKLSKSYELTYPQMIELQAQYNERLENYFRSTTIRFLKPVEEASFFGNTLEQVRGGVRHFKLPKVSQVEVVWLEAYENQKQIEELKKMAFSGRFDEKLPVLFSSCLSRQDMNLWLSEHNLDQAGFYLLSAEWLSPYNSEKALKSGLAIELSKMLEGNVKVNVLVPKNTPLPTELIIQ